MSAAVTGSKARRRQAWIQALSGTLMFAASIVCPTLSEAQVSAPQTPAPQAEGLALKADTASLCALVGKLQVIAFRYGYDPVTAEPRELEPYAVGYTRQRNVLLFGRQVKGYSKSSAAGAEAVPLPGWRNFRIDKIDKGVVNARISTFDPVRPSPDEHRYISEFVCKNELVQ
jgi:hypothetical protein